jgi:hypothetical protein
VWRLKLGLVQSMIRSPKPFWIIKVLGVLVTHEPCSLRSVHLATVGMPLQSASNVIVWCLPLIRVEHELIAKQVTKMLVHVKKSVLLVFIKGLIFRDELVSA